MNIIATYKNRIEKFSALEKINQKKGTTFPLIRLSVAVIGLVSFYLLFSVNIIFSLIILFFFILIFAYFAMLDVKNSTKLQHYKTLKLINENEIKCLEGNYDSFPNGNEYKDQSHYYTSDLDVFGRFSIFQYLNRCSFKISNDTLASWLKLAANYEEIICRQEAINELKDKIEWRQTIYALGLQQNAIEKNPVALINWLNEPAVFMNRNKLILACKILPVFTLTALILSFVFLPNVIAITFVFIQMYIINTTKNAVAIIHQKVSRNVSLLNAYAVIIETIENEKFNAPKLIKLVKNFRINSISAHGTLKFLSGVINRLDYRYNIIVHFFLNTFLFWDIHQIVRLERWKTKNGSHVEKWFASIGELEVLSSMANMSFNNPKWAFPKLANDKYVFCAKEIGHPLIAEKARVCNDLMIADSSKIVLVTGSNMSGKSTFLRTAGINIVLAMAGSVVCAKEFMLSHLNVFTSMRIVDSLEENTSSFYAELKRLGAIIKRIETEDSIFLLLDEILRGTNSNDRHIGSMAFIKQLIKNKSVGIVATHDIGLSELASQMPGNIENFNFDVRTENDELYFDYKLNKGVCSSLNATLLMKKIGIEI